MNINILLHSIFYIITSIFLTIGEKINDKYYNYNNYWIIIFYINILFPINIFIFCVKYSFYDLINLIKNIKLIKRMSLYSIINTIETILLYWALINIPLSVYIIGRTLNAYFNIPFSLWYLNKKISILYYIGLISLIGSYILLGMNYTNYLINTYSIISIIIVVFSGFTTALCSNLIEKHLSEFTDDKFKIQLFCQIMNNIYGFIFFFPISIGFCWNNNLFDNRIVPNLIYLLVGLSFQICFLFKIFILGYNNYAGSQIIASLDLIRRVFTNIISYNILQDYFNNEIIGVNIFMIIGGIFIILAQKNNKKYDLLDNMINNTIIDIELNKL
jgi:hypothetical protein